MDRTLTLQAEPKKQLINKQVVMDVQFTRRAFIQFTSLHSPDATHLFHCVWSSVTQGKADCTIGQEKCICNHERSATASLANSSRWDSSLKGIHLYHELRFILHRIHPSHKLSTEICFISITNWDSLTEVLWNARQHDTEIRFISFSNWDSTRKCFSFN